jgi:hypothetical protein
MRRAGKELEIKAYATIDFSILRTERMRIQVLFKRSSFQVR